MAHLTLKGINKIYPNGFHAVHDFNLEIDRGEFIGLDKHAVAYNEKKRAKKAEAAAAEAPAEA